MQITFKVPTRDQVTENYQAIFDILQNVIGFIPKLYAAMAHSGTAHSNYLQFQNAKTSLSKKESK